MDVYRLVALKEVSEAINVATAQLSQAPTDALNDVRICLQELLVNAFQHHQGEKKELWLSWQTEQGAYIFFIEEDPRQIPDGLFELPRMICEEDLLKENGRGLFLVQALADEICYNEETGCLKGVIRW